MSFNRKAFENNTFKRNHSKENLNNCLYNFIKPNLKHEFLFITLINLNKSDSCKRNQNLAKEIKILQNLIRMLQNEFANHQQHLP